MDAFVGSIVAFGFNFAPYNWQQCNGQIINIQQNTTLFALLGTYYGGNGTSTFGLPNLQGRMAIGFGQGPGLAEYDLGETAGADTAALTLSTMPLHNHTTAVTPPGGPISATLNAVAATGTLADPTGALIGGAKGITTTNFIAPGGATGTMATQAVSITGGTTTGVPTITLANSAGGNTPFSIHQPTLAINYSVCMYGIFPARS